MFLQALFVPVVTHLTRVLSSPSGRVVLDRSAGGELAGLGVALAFAVPIAA